MQKLSFQIVVFIYFLYGTGGEVATGNGTLSETAQLVCKTFHYAARARIRREVRTGL